MRRAAVGFRRPASGTLVRFRDMVPASQVLEQRLNLLQPEEKRCAQRRRLGCSLRLRLWLDHAQSTGQSCSLQLSCVSFREHRTRSGLAPWPLAVFWVLGSLEASVSHSRPPFFAETKAFGSSLRQP